MTISEDKSQHGNRRTTQRRTNVPMRTQVAHQVRQPMCFSRKSAPLPDQRPPVPQTSSAFQRPRANVHTHGSRAVPFPSLARQLIPRILPRPRFFSLVGRHCPPFPPPSHARVPMLGNLGATTPSSSLLRSGSAPSQSAHLRATPSLVCLLCSDTRSLARHGIFATCHVGDSQLASAMAHTHQFEPFLVRVSARNPRIMICGIIICAEQTREGTCSTR
ncbi:hypothetical protein L226DRAFT_329053 [Lentinus tigrinus ALCF2SS1-7]|uniref:Uncharacterized protein n=1 Tax=Lentinus tigrinus ALCF2SS1-6 TaxID=1328759 RepID=A0A5C2SFP2_9APHY|nr:hypothetical protein L227DRAFT_429394 [Lentinus tigrinus ALCF2SS1-6]RPD77682.1 hypothetical protein L226DRAFT_329053 [Lentinus tigrinus ALCF2SS1-7]